MCDYSLEQEKSRPAVKGEKLKTHRFRGGTCGFIPIEGEPVAVCLLPGTEVAFSEPVKGGATGIDEKTGYTTAVFARHNLDDRLRHHDSLEFPDGQVILLNHLSSGQIATVVQMPASSRPKKVLQKLVDLLSA